MSDENPPPYSTVVATPVEKTPDSEPPEITLPFSGSNSLAVKILTLIPEGKTLDSHFRDVRDLAAASTRFECQEHAVILSQRFEILIWESRRIAGTALVAIKDFNELVLGFLSNPDAVIQDRLKELAHASKLLQAERNSSANQKNYFDALVKKTEDFHQMIHSELGAPNPKRRRQSHSDDRETTATRPPRKFMAPFSISRSEPVSGLSAVTAFIGVFPRRFVDCAQQFERMAEQNMLPSWTLNSQPEASAQIKKDTNPSAASPGLPLAEHKRLGSPIEHADPVALPGLVDALLRDLRTFVSQMEVFDTVLSELARVQDIFILYLKDGQSVANQGYRLEIHRLREQLPCVCNALDAYSKAKLP